MNFVVPGEPVPLARPRKGQYGNMYMPKESMVFEGTIAWAARAHGGRFGKRDVIVYTDFFCKRKRGDGDNFHKAVLDALEKAEVYDNDRQVVEGHYRVFRGVSNPRTEIVIYAVDLTSIA